MSRFLGSLRTTYYAFGGGLGHAVRTLAFDRAWRSRVSGPRRWLVNTPFAREAARLAANDPLGDPPELVALSPFATPAEAAAWIAAELAAHPPDVLVVDVFPRGLGGELVEPLRAWAEGSLAFGRRPTLVLIARTLPADYIARYRLLDEVAAHFDLVLAPGEDSPFVAGLPSRSRVVRSPAFLLRNATELPSREEAARRLSVAPETGAVLCVGSGGDAECAAVRDIARYLVSTDRAFGYRLRLALPDHDADSPSGPLPLAGDDGWEGLLAHVSPLIEVLPAAAAIIGGAGYNLVHEARALGVPGCWRAWPRKYDDQAARVGRDATFATADDVVRWLAERGDSLRPPVGPPSYVNGATVAADALAAVL